ATDGLVENGLLELIDMLRFAVDLLEVVGEALPALPRGFGCCGPLQVVQYGRLQALVYFPVLVNFLFQGIDLGKERFYFLDDALLLFERWEGYESVLKYLSVEMRYRCTSGIIIIIFKLGVQKVIKKLP